MMDEANITSDAVADDKGDEPAIVSPRAKKTDKAEKSSTGAAKSAPVVQRPFRRAGLHEVGAEVPYITAPAFHKFGFHAVQILMNWPTIAGSALAAYTSPKRIKWPRMPDASAFEANASGTAFEPAKKAERTALQVWVDGGRAHEMPYLKGPIMERINQYFGYKAITDIEPIAGPVAREAPLARPVLPPMPQLPADATPLDRALAEMAALRKMRQQKS